MAKLLIVYYSRTGNTEAMAQAISEGAQSAGHTVTLKKPDEATGDDLLNCDASAFGTPNYFGYMAGTMKDFFDQIWSTHRDSAANKPYASFGSAGGGGRQALDSIDRVCSSFGLKKASEGVVAARKPSSEVLEQCKELGKKLAQL